MFDETRDFRGALSLLSTVAHQSESLGGSCAASLDDSETWVGWSDTWGGGCGGGRGWIRYLIVRFTSERRGSVSECRNKPAFAGGDDLAGAVSGARSARALAVSFGSHQAVGKVACDTLHAGDMLTRVTHTNLSTHLALRACISMPGVLVVLVGRPMESSHTG